MAIYPAETPAQAIAEQNQANAYSKAHTNYLNAMAQYNAGMAQQQLHPGTAALINPDIQHQKAAASAAASMAKIGAPQASATYNPGAMAATNQQILNKQLAGSNANTQIYNAASAPHPAEVAAAKPPTATYAMQPIAQQAQPAPNPMASRIGAIGSAIAGRA